MWSIDMFATPDCTNQHIMPVSYVEGLNMMQLCHNYSAIVFYMVKQMMDWN